MASYLRKSVYCLPTDRRSLCLRPGRGPSMLPLGGTTSIRDTLARYRSSGRRFAVLLRPGLDCWSLELRTLNPPFNGSTSRSDPLPVAPPIAHSANQVSSAPHPTLDRSARNDVSGMVRPFGWIGRDQFCGADCSFTSSVQGLRQSVQPAHPATAFVLRGPVLSELGGSCPSNPASMCCPFRLR
jgi:hypothetical protein